MTDSPRAGPVHSRGTGTGACTRPRHPTPRSRTNSSSPPSTACAVRRRRQGPTAAARSALSGRSLTPTPHPGAPKSRRRTAKERSPSKNRGLTGPAPSGMTPTPHPGAPKSRRRTAKEKITEQEQGVDRPRSFRDDCLPPSGQMLTWSPQMISPRRKRCRRNFIVASPRDRNTSRDEFPADRVFCRTHRIQPRSASFELACLKEALTPVPRVLLSEIRLPTAPSAVLARSGFFGAASTLPGTSRSTADERDVPVGDRGGPVASAGGAGARRDPVRAQSTGHGMVGHQPGPRAGARAADRRAVRARQRRRPEATPPRGDRVAGLARRPARPNLAGPVAGQRGRRRRRGVAPDSRAVVAHDRPILAGAGRRDRRSVHGRDLRRSGAAQHRLAGGRGAPRGRPGPRHGPGP